MTRYIGVVGKTPMKSKVKKPARLRMPRPYKNGPVKLVPIPEYRHTELKKRAAQEGRLFHKLIFDLLAKGEEYEKSFAQKVSNV